MDKVEGQLPLCQGVIWNGAPVMDAEFGCTQNVATIQTAWQGKEEQTHVIGLTILLVWIMLTTTDLKIEVPISGKTCPFPGSLPHGSWTCEMQEIPIQGTSFLDEAAQSYPGKLNWKGSQAHLIWYIFSPSMPAGVWGWLCCPANTSNHLCQRRICKRVSLSPDNFSFFPNFTHFTLQMVPFSLMFLFALGLDIFQVLFFFIVCCV